MLVEISIKQVKRQTEKSMVGQSNHAFSVFPKMKYSIEEIASYVWDKIINPKINKHKHVKISSRRIKNVWNDYKKITEHYINNGYLKILPMAQGGYLKGVSTYEVLTPYITINYDNFEERTKQIIQKRFSKVINIEGLTFENITLMSNDDQKKINYILENGLDVKDYNKERRFSSNLCNISKEARKHFRYNGEELLEIDINATIPRLLVAWGLKNIKEGHPDHQEIMIEIGNWRNCVIDQDAYVGLMNYMNINISRSEFKEHFLKILFGCGIKETIKQEIADKLMEYFPRLYTLLKEESKNYRIAKKANIQTWKETFFAQKIFNLEARIINKTLSELDCMKFSVYDAIFAPKHMKEQIKALLEANWSLVVEDAETFCIKISDEQELHFATATSVPDDTFDSKFSIVDEKKHTVERGGGGDHISATLSNDTKINDTKNLERSDAAKPILMKTDIKIRKVDNNGSDAWMYRGTNIQIKKSCKKYTEEEFKEYVLSKLNEKDENMTQPITKTERERFLDRMAVEWSTKDDSKPGNEVLSSRPPITSPETKPLKSVSKPKEKTVFEIYAEILGEEI